jgi:Family of unknown function (DUF5681)
MRDASIPHCDRCDEPEYACQCDKLQAMLKARPPPAENTAKKQRGRPFGPGRSGNPQGRPRGSRNKATMAVEALLDGDADAIARKAVERALEGDMAALRLCLERLLPPRRDRPVVFDLPKIEGVSDALNASSAVLTACAAGNLSPGEAVEVMGLISSHVRVLEMTDIEARLTALEKAQQP